MKFKFFLLSLTILAAGQAMPANAQGHAQEGQSRWTFAPNVYGAKGRVKNVQPAYVPHAVTAGAMPHSNAFLGVDPSRLAPPPRPEVQQQTQIAVSVPHVQAAPFSNDFGAPIGEQSARPNQMTQSQMPAARSMSPSRSSGVSGRLRTPVHSIARVAHANSLPTIQSYGSGNGYTPGAAGAGTGASTMTGTAVSGVIVGRHR